MDEIFTFLEDQDVIYLRIIRIRVLIVLEARWLRILKIGEKRVVCWFG